MAARAFHSRAWRGVSDVTCLETKTVQREGGEGVQGRLE